MHIFHAVPGTKKSPSLPKQATGHRLCRIGHFLVGFLWRELAYHYPFSDSGAYRLLLDAYPRM